MGKGKTSSGLGRSTGGDSLSLQRNRLVPGAPGTGPAAAVAPGLPAPDDSGEMSKGRRSWDKVVFTSHSGVKVHPVDRCDMGFDQVILIKSHRCTGHQAQPGV